MSDEKLADELRKSVIRKFNRRKVHSLFIDNICAADLGDMQLMKKLYEFVFIMCY